jgi:tellurite resistance protein TehA-like permease
MSGEMMKITGIILAAGALILFFTLQACLLVRKRQIRSELNGEE